MKLDLHKKTSNRLIKNIRTDLSGWLLLLPGLFLFFYLVWRPIFIGVTYSFFDIKGFRPIEFIGFDN